MCVEVLTHFCCGHGANTHSMCVCAQSWTKFVGERHAAWVASKERHVRVHGVGVWESLRKFYSAMDKYAVTKPLLAQTSLTWYTQRHPTNRLFAGGNLGGVRIAARRPPQA